MAENLYLSPYAKPGAYNDMDMLEVGHLKGQVKTAFGKSDEGLTADEEALHFGTWCILSSPLLIGCDVRALPAQTMDLITNPYLLAMSQNDLGLQAYVAQRVGNDGYVLAKDAVERFGKSRYAALLNLSDESLEFTVESRTLDLGGEVEVFDLVERADPGSFSNRFTLSLRPHSARFFRFDAERRVQRRVYEAECAYLADYQELRDAAKAGTAFPAPMAGASGGMIVRYLGNRATNYLEWRDVKVDADGEYVLSISYFSPDDRSFDVAIDGGMAQKVEVKGSDGKISMVKMAYKLAAGVHSVRLSNANGWMPDIDGMTL